MNRVLSVIAVIAVAVFAGCSDSTNPGDDPNPVTIDLPSLSVPMMVVSGDRLYTLRRAVDTTTRELDARRLDGQLIWTVTVPLCGQISDACFLVADASGNVYFNTSDGLMSRSRSNGSLRWTVSSLARVASMAIAPSGRIYVADRDGTPGLMYAVDANTGAVVWSSILPPFNASATLFDEARSVIYALGRGAAAALDAQTGAIKWITSQNCFAGSDGALAADGTIYVTCDSDLSSRLFAYSPAGATVWQASLGASTATLTPVIDAAGIIYVANNGSVTALNKDGTTAWRLAGLFRNNTHPMIDSNRNLYAVASRISSVSGRYLIAINNGVVVETKGLFPCSGALLLTESGRLYCAEVALVMSFPTSGNDVAAQWNQMGHDASRTARR